MRSGSTRLSPELNKARSRPRNGPISRLALGKDSIYLSHSFQQSLSQAGTGCAVTQAGDDRTSDISEGKRACHISVPALCKVRLLSDLGDPVGDPTG